MVTFLFGTVDNAGSRAYQFKVSEFAKDTKETSTTRRQADIFLIFSPVDPHSQLFFTISTFEKQQTSLAYLVGAPSGRS